MLIKHTHYIIHGYNALGQRERVCVVGAATIDSFETKNSPLLRVQPGLYCCYLVLFYCINSSCRFLASYSNSMVEPDCVKDICKC